MFSSRQLMTSPSLLTHCNSLRDNSWHRIWIRWYSYASQIFPHRYIVTVGATFSSGQLMTSPSLLHCCNSLRDHRIRQYSYAWQIFSHRHIVTVWAMFSSKQRMTSPSLLHYCNSLRDNTWQQNQAVQLCSKHFHTWAMFSSGQLMTPPLLLVLQQHTSLGVTDLIRTFAHQQNNYHSTGNFVAQVWGP